MNMVLIMLALHSIYLLSIQSSLKSKYFNSITSCDEHKGKRHVNEPKDLTFLFNLGRIFSEIIFFNYTMTKTSINSNHENCMNTTEIMFCVYTC